MPSTTINLEAGSVSFMVIVEPWGAPEFEVKPLERCEIIIEHPAIIPTVTSGVVGGKMYVTVYESGSTFKMVREGVVDFETPVAAF